MKRQAVVLVASAAGAILLITAAGLGIRTYFDEEARLTPPIVEPTPVFDGEGALAAFIAEYGEAPPREPYTDAERDAARQWDAETLGVATLNFYPSATLPSLVFASYDDNARASCLSAAGAPTDYEYGQPVLEPEAEAIGAYSCLGTFPPAPHRRPTDRQMHYVYAYWTKFLVPCFEAFGFSQTPPIPEDEFLARYGMHGWTPDYPESTWEEPVEPWLLAEVDAACPASLPGS